LPRFLNYFRAITCGLNLFVTNEYILLSFNFTWFYYLNIILTSNFFISSNLTPRPNIVFSAAPQPDWVIPPDRQQQPTPPHGSVNDNFKITLSSQWMNQGEQVTSSGGRYTPSPANSRNSSDASGQLDSFCQVVENLCDCLIYLINSFPLRTP